MKSVAPYGVVTSATPLVPQERESRSRKALPLAVVGVALCLTAAACVLGTQSGSALVSGVSHRGFFRRQISKSGNGNRKLKLFNDHWMRCYDTKTDGDYNKIGDGLVECVHAAAQSPCLLHSPSAYVSFHILKACASANTQDGKEAQIPAIATAHESSRPSTEAHAREGQGCE